MVSTLRGHEIDCESFQSNSEGEIIDWLHKNRTADFLLLNPGALTHTSVGLRDAVLGVGIPFIEIHLSNVHKREEFRHHSYFSDIAIGALSGLGVKGYLLAAEFAIDYIEQKLRSTQGFDYLSKISLSISFIKMRVSSSTFILFFNLMLGGIASYIGGSLLSTWMHYEVVSFQSPRLKNSRL